MCSSILCHAPHGYVFLYDRRDKWEHSVIMWRMSTWVFFLYPQGPSDCPPSCRCNVKCWQLWPMCTERVWECSNQAETQYLCEMASGLRTFDKPFRHFYLLKSMWEKAFKWTVGDHWTEVFHSIFSELFIWSIARLFWSLFKLFGFNIYYSVIKKHSYLSRPSQQIIVWNRYILNDLDNIYKYISMTNGNLLNIFI